MTKHMNWWLISNLLPAGLIIFGDHVSRKLMQTNTGDSQAPVHGDNERPIMNSGESSGPHPLHHNNEL